MITILLGVYPKPVFDVTTPGGGQADRMTTRPRWRWIMPPKSWRLPEGSRAMNLQADLLVLLPELILALGAMALLLAGAIGGEKTAPAISWGAIAAAGRCRRGRGAGPEQATAFHGAFVADGFSRFAKLLILIGRGALHPAGGGILRRHRPVAL